MPWATGGLPCHGPRPGASPDRTSDRQTAGAIRISIADLILLRATWGGSIVPFGIATPARARRQLLSRARRRSRCRAMSPPRPPSRRHSRVAYLDADLFDPALVGNVRFNTKQVMRIGAF